MSRKIKLENPKYRAKSAKGMGDNYGVGSAPKIGKMRSSYVEASPVSKKKISKPPLSIK